MTIKQVSGSRVDAGHRLYQVDAATLDANGYVEWTGDGGQIHIEHQANVNLALGINNTTGGAIAWAIYPVLADGTVCATAADSGSISATTADVVYDEVLGAGRYVVHLDTAGEYVEVTLK